MELTTERVEFEIADPSQGKTTLGGFDVQSIAIEKFSVLAFEPHTFEIADPSQYRVETDDFPPSAWRSLRSSHDKIALVAKGQERHPRVTVESRTAVAQDPIHLDPLPVRQGTRVTMESRGGKSEGLTIKIAGQETITLSFHEPLRLIADYTELRGLAGFPFPNHDELTYHVTLPERASWIEIAAASDGLVLSPTFASRESATSILKAIPIATLDFTRQDSFGERVSAPTGRGTISFPDYPHLGTVPLEE